MALPPPGVFVQIPKDIYIEVAEPNLIGAMIGWGLFGFGMLQFYHCFRRLSPKKHTFTFFYILLLFFTDIADQVVKGAYLTLYYRHVALGGLGAMFVLPKPVLGYQILSGVVGSEVHFYYLRRLIKVTPRERKGWWLWVVVTVGAILSIVQLVFAIECGINPVKLPEAIWNTSIYLGCAMAVDILITVTLLATFWGMRTEFQRTNDLLNRWIALTVETGLLTVIIQFLELIFFVPVPLRTKGYVYAAAYIGPKIYVNSVLVLVRSVLRESGDSSHATSFDQKRSYVSRPAIRTQHAGHLASSNGIMVSTSVHREADIELGSSRPDDSGSEKMGYGDMQGGPHRLTFHD